MPRAQSLYEALRQTHPSAASLRCPLPDLDLPRLGTVTWEGKWIYQHPLVQLGAHARIGPLSLNSHDLVLPAPKVRGHPARCAMLVPLCPPRGDGAPLHVALREMFCFETLWSRKREWNWEPELHLELLLRARAVCCFSLFSRDNVERKHCTNRGEGHDRHRTCPRLNKPEVETRRELHS